jgi:short-subunit dehydrogenase
MEHAIPREESMAKKVSGRVAIITGASSGIGRATALELSKSGMNLVLAARRSNLLEDVAKECRKAGAHAIAVPTEISDPAAVEMLAAKAIREFGDFDIWINNAGVTTIGRFQDVPQEEDRRVIEVNVLGYLYGAKQAIRHFIRRGKGTLINVSSIVGKLSEPYSSAYTASKHAVRGLGLSLRQELWLEKHQNIHVCTVLPAVIDTPLFQHAGNHIGHPIKAMPPVYSAGEVARAILHLIETPQDEVFVGRSAKMMNTAESMIPWQTHKQLAKAIDKKHFHEALYVEPDAGNLFEPMQDKHKVSGGWHKERSKPSGISALFGIAALASAAAIAWLKNSGSSRRTATVTRFPEQPESTPQSRPLAVNETALRRERGLDRTIADTFPTSDPPSSIPNPAYGEKP